MRTRVIKKSELKRLIENLIKEAYRDKSRGKRRALVSEQSTEDFSDMYEQSTEDLSDMYEQSTEDFSDMYEQSTEDFSDMYEGIFRKVAKKSL